MSTCCALEMKMCSRNLTQPKGQSGREQGGVNAEHCPQLLSEETQRGWTGPSVDLVSQRVFRSP